MLWILVGAVIIVGLAAAIAVQRRHEVDLVEILQPLCGRRLDLAIAPTSSKLAIIVEYTGVIEAIDSTTRWVSFEWIDILDGGEFGT